MSRHFPPRRGDRGPHGEGAEPTRDVDPDATQRLDPYLAAELGRPEEVTHRIGPTQAFPRREVEVGWEHTEVIPLAQRASRVPAFVLALILVALLGGGTAGYLERTPQPSGVVARALVGPRGGRIVFEGDGHLDLPSGALSTATTITVRRVHLAEDIVLTRPDGSAVRFASLDAYAFEPAGLAFAAPVTIALPAPPGADTVLVVAGRAVRAVVAAREGGTLVLTTQSFAFP